MDIKFEQFIGVFDNVYPDGYCEHMIGEFERLLSSGAGFNRWRSEKTHKHRKDDTQIVLDIKSHNFKNFENIDVVDLFFQNLQKCFEEYVQRYSILTDQRLIATAVKMQKTAPGEGYHIWHHENGDKKAESRVLTYILYLNDLKDDDGGETEFLYQKKRIAPKKNTMVIWPAGFTHPHRGNLVLGNEDKYVITGWFYNE